MGTKVQNRSFRRTQEQERGGKLSCLRRLLLSWGKEGRHEAGEVRGRGESRTQGLCSCVEVLFRGLRRCGGISNCRVTEPDFYCRKWGCLWRGEWIRAR